MKKSIVGVCKTWHQVGSEVLYEEVALRRIGQVATFCRTLEISPFGSYVRQLTVNCFVPRGYANLYKTEMDHILQYCHRVYRFDLTPPYLLSLTSYRLTSADLPITHLQFSCAVDFTTAIDFFVALRHTLKSLFWALPPDADFGATPALTLEQLDTLHIKLHRSTPAEMDLWMAKWHAPRLTKLAVALSMSPGQDPFLAIYAAHRHKLEYVFLELPRDKATIEYLQLQFDSFPSLRHLALRPHVYFDFDGIFYGLGHPTVQWIELVEEMGEQQRSENWRHLHELLVEKSFPSLRGINQVDIVLGCLPDLLMSLPSLRAEGCQGVYDLSGYSIVNGNGYFCREDVLLQDDDIKWIVPDGSDSESDADDSNDDDDDDDDADFVEGSSDESDNNSDLSYSDDVRGLWDEFYHQEEEHCEMDRDSTLSIYLDTIL